MISVWKHLNYYRHELAFAVGGAIDNFPVNSAFFKFKQKITGVTGNDRTKYTTTIVLLKHFSNFSGTPKVLFISIEINFMN